MHNYEEFQSAGDLRSKIDNVKSSDSKQFIPAQSERETCICQSLPSFARDSNHVRLAEVSNCKDYIAVSYCCARKHSWNWMPGRKECPLLVQQGDQKRHSRAPADILCRAIRYATSYDIKLIWIDQGCIGQDDPLDKKIGIQSMDLVYTRVRFPVAFTDCYLKSQVQIDLLQLISSEKVAKNAAYAHNDVFIFLLR